MRLPREAHTRELRTVQRELSRRLDPTGPLPGAPLWIGCDCAVGGGETVAAVVAWDDGAALAATAVRTPTDFPYIPGLLSFREVPALLAALSDLLGHFDVAGRVPVLVVDGHGLIHPERLGIAAHLSLLAGHAGIGVAKKPFVAEAVPPGRARGSRTPARVDGEHVGWALRTRRDVRPVWASPGDRLGLEAVAGTVLELARPYRLPEPIRWADRICGAVRRGAPVPDLVRTLHRSCSWRDALSPD